MRYIVLSMKWRISVLRLNEVSSPNFQTILPLLRFQGAIPFSLMISCPAIPPDTTRREELLA
jgi:hypothetical protein